MDINKKAVETLKKNYEEYYKIDNIKIVYFSKDVLEEALKVCNSTKHIEWRTELYDDEDQPDWNTWVDVEGEGYGWLWVQEEDNEEKWHGLIKDKLIEFVEDKKKENNNGEYVIIVEAEGQYIYHFIEREKYFRDTVFTFSNDEIFY